MSTPTINMEPGVETVLPKNNSESPFLSIGKTFTTISPAAQEFVNQKTFTVFVRKGEKLLTSGEHSPNIYYLKTGIMRSYVRDGIKDITTWITGENEFIAAVTSFGLRQPAKENIQALEDSELSGIRYDDLEHLYQHYPETNIVGRKVLEKYFRDAEERAFIARLTEATSKYKHFIATKNHMLNRVPLKFIASYLGMTLETLSRIRSKLSKSPNGAHI